MGILDSVRDDVVRIFQEWRTRLENVDFGGLGDLKKQLAKLLPQLIVLAESTGRTGAEKKAIVRAGVAEWYDTVIAPKDIPHLPDWLIDPMIREALLVLTDEAVDFVVAAMNNFGLLRAGA